MNVLMLVDHGYLINKGFVLECLRADVGVDEYRLYRDCCTVIYLLNALHKEYNYQCFVFYRDKRKPDAGGDFNKVDDLDKFLNTI